MRRRYQISRSQSLASNPTQDGVVLLSSCFFLNFRSVKMVKKSFWFFWEYFSQLHIFNSGEIHCVIQERPNRHIACVVLCMTSSGRRIEVVSILVFEWPKKIIAVCDREGKSVWFWNLIVTEFLVVCSAGSRKWLISCSFADTKYRYSKPKWCRLTCAYFSHLWLFTRSSMSIYIRYKTRTSFAKFHSFCWLSNLGQIYQKN